MAQSICCLCGLCDCKLDSQLLREQSVGLRIQNTYAGSLRREPGVYVGYIRMSEFSHVIRDWLIIHCHFSIKVMSFIIFKGTVISRKLPVITTTRFSSGLTWIYCPLVPSAKYPGAESFPSIHQRYP